MLEGIARYFCQRTAVIIFGLFATFGIALLILAFGYLLSRLGFFRAICLPASILGGVLALFALWFLAHFFELKISFDESLKEPFLLAFFASLSLGFAFSKSIKFTKNFFIFLGLCALLMILQNLLGIMVISLFGADKIFGLIAGSISLSGSFGMGAFWSEVLKTEPFNITNALDISIACATFGVLFGSLLGAPFGAFLIEKCLLKKRVFAPDFSPDFSANFAHNKSSKIANSRISKEIFVLFSNKKELKNTIISIFLLVFCVICAIFIKSFIALPAIIFALIFGLIVRAFCAFLRLELPSKSIATLGNFCLALFLVLALVLIDLSVLFSLATPLFVLLFCQLVLMVLFVYFITFRAFGRGYEAGLLSSAQCGLSLGATPIALANLEKLELRFFSSKEAVAIVCLSGVFFIDFINVLVVWGFLSLL